MTQVVLNINSKKKWDALKTILEVMDIEYITQDTGTIEKMSETEIELLNRAEKEIENGKVTAYNNHRQILAQ